MLYVCLSILGIFAACLIPLALMLFFAPPGWEDKDGFHRGDYPRGYHP